MSWTPSAQTLSNIGSMGNILSAFGQYQEGRQAQVAQNYNADIFKQRADVTRQGGILEHDAYKKKIDLVIGEQIAGYAASGVDVSTGSPLETIKDSLANGYLDMAINDYNNEIAARSYESEAQMLRYKGKQVAREATMRAGMTVARTSLLALRGQS